MVDSEVESAASFLKTWVASTVVIVCYAWLDLRLTPRLAHETSFTLTPDITRFADLWDWGGRLLHHGAVGLLLLNAIGLGGLLALVIRSALAGIRGLRRSEDAVRVSIVPASVPTSVPPPSP